MEEFSKGRWKIYWLEYKGSVVKLVKRRLVHAKSSIAEVGNKYIVTKVNNIAD